MGCLRWLPHARSWHQWLWQLQVGSLRAHRIANWRLPALPRKTWQPLAAGWADTLLPCAWLPSFLATRPHRAASLPAQAIVHSGWIDLHGRVVRDYDPTADRPAAFDLHGVNRWACDPLAACAEGLSTLQAEAWHACGRAGRLGPLTRREGTRGLDLTADAALVACSVVAGFSTAGQCGMFDHALAQENRQALLYCLAAALCCRQRALYPLAVKPVTQGVHLLCLPLPHWRPDSPGWLPSKSPGAGSSTAAGPPASRPQCAPCCWCTMPAGSSCQQPQLLRQPWAALAGQRRAHRSVLGSTLPSGCMPRPGQQRRPRRPQHGRGSGAGRRSAGAAPAAQALQRSPRRRLLTPSTWSQVAAWMCSAPSAAAAVQLLLWPMVGATWWCGAPRWACCHPSW